MELWRKVWRNGLVPQLSTNELLALKHGLETDDPKLVQGITTSPPAIDIFATSQVEFCCGLTYSSWKGENKTTVAEADARYTQLCQNTDELLGEPGVSRFFLNWFDETPRVEMRRQLLTEVVIALSNRKPALAG